MSLCYHTWMLLTSKLPKLLLWRWLHRLMINKAHLISSTWLRLTLLIPVVMVMVYSAFHSQLCLSCVMMWYTTFCCSHEAVFTQVLEFWRTTWLVSYVLTCKTLELKDGAFLFHMTVWWYFKTLLSAPLLSPFFSTFLLQPLIQTYFFCPFIMATSLPADCRPLFA